MEENIMQDARITPAPRKRPEIIRILIYVGIMLGLNLVASLFDYTVRNTLVWPLLDSGRVNSTIYSVISLIFSRMHTYGVCIIQGILFRRLVFRSKASAFLPILVMCGLNYVFIFIRTIISTSMFSSVYSGAMTTQQYNTCIMLLSNISMLIVATLGYIIMRCGFYKRTLDTLMKPRAPLADTGYLSDTEEGA